MAEPSTPQGIIDWCQREAASLEQQLELFESGQLRSSMKMEFGAWQDTTDQAMAGLKNNLAELKRILSEAAPQTKTDG